MSYLPIHDLTLYYEEHGSPDSPPMVLLHGFSGTGDRAWRRVIPAFADRWRLIVPDYRGHGRTNNPAGPEAMNHRQFARDAAALCRALHIEQAVFWGSSSGAMQLLTLALEEPSLARALILCAGSHFYPDALRDMWRTLTPEKWVSEERRAGLQEAHTALGPHHWREVVAAWIALGQHPHSADFPEAHELTAIAAPTLIVHGDRDQFFPAEMPLALHRLIPESELCILPNTGHGALYQHPDLITTLVQDFLARRT